MSEKETKHANGWQGRDAPPERLFGGWHEWYSPDGHVAYSYSQHIPFFILRDIVSQDTGVSRDRLVAIPLDEAPHD